MIAARFAEQLERDGTRTALRTAERDWTYAELYEAADGLGGRLAHRAGETIGIVGSDLPQRIIGLLAADKFGLTPCLYPAGGNRANRLEGIERLELVDLLDAGDWSGESPSCSKPQLRTPKRVTYYPAVWLFTSGTTGTPQPVLHSWRALTNTIHTGPRYEGRRWLLAYDAFSFAGLQVTLQALLTGGTLSDVSQATPDEAARRIVTEQVAFASGTPTFWRMQLGAVDPAFWKQAALEQITLGGEAVSAGTLAALKAAFPQARLSHIYATSELGVCFSVSDGHAGFPAGYLQHPPVGCELRISVEGELEVLSSRRARTLVEDDDLPVSSTPTATWLSTGDLVELQGDRVYFIGRKTGTINVGGGKVLPEEVEAVIRNVPGVAEVRVSGQASSVLGTIVRADVVPMPNVEHASVRTAILATCQTQLPRHKVPAMIEFHITLPRTSSGKLARSGPVE